MKLSFFLWRKKRFPFLSLLLAAIAGILVEDYFSFPSYWLLFIAVPLGARVLLPLVALERSKVLYIFVAACFGILHAWQWKESPACQLAGWINKSEENLSVEGRIISEPKNSKNGHATFFLVTKKIAFGTHTVSLPVTMRVCWEGVPVAYGDEVAFQARASAPEPPRNPGEFDAVEWLTRKEVWTELKIDPSDPGKILSSNHGSLFLRWSFAVRHWAERTLALGVEQAPDVVALLQGITLGLTAHSPADVFLNDFKLTGTMHLFAVSGLHVGMMAAILWFLLKLFRLSRLLAIGLSIAGLFLYVMITGFHTGSWRAFIMAAIVLSGFLFDRRPQLLNSLAAAGFCLLIAETNLLFSPGWQFSFGVVAAIVILAQPLQKLLQPWCESDPFIPKKLLSSWQVRWNDILHHSVQLVSVSLAAWVGALIPSIFYFHRISFSALGANVVAVPLAFCILSIAVITLVSGLFSSWLATVFNNANFIFAKLLLLVVHGWTLLPWSSMAVSTSISWHPTITLFDIPGSQVAFLEDRNMRWLINTGNRASTGKMILPFLETKGITRLYGLFFTGGEANSLGGASLLLRALTVDSLLIPEGEIHSPSFHQLLRLLEEKKQATLKIQGGERFSLSPNVVAEVFSPLNKEKALVLKICNGSESFLFLPILTHEIEEWLLQHAASTQLHATVLLLPSISIPPSPDDAFLKTVAPKYVIIGSDPHHQVTPNPAWKEFFQQHGITLLYQEETGALVFEMLPGSLKVEGWLTSSLLLPQRIAAPQ